MPKMSVICCQRFGFMKVPEGDERLLDEQYKDLPILWRVLYAPQALAIVHSRSTVVGKTLSASAVSSIESPPKILTQSPRSNGLRSS
jgi:hypothetical protein